MFKGPWPHPEMWWCACITNDCYASLLGPFENIEGAKLEADGDCDNAHIAVKGEPPLNSPTLLGEPCVAYELRTAETGDWHFWYMKNRTTLASADFAHIVSQEELEEAYGIS